MLNVSYLKYFIKTQHARKLPGQRMLQEFFVLADSIHQQIEILLNSVRLFKQGTWHCRREQRERSIIHHLQTRKQQQSSQVSTQGSTGLETHPGLRSLSGAKEVLPLLG